MKKVVVFNRKRVERVVALTVALFVMANVLGGCGKKVSDKDEQGRTIISVGSWPQKEGTALDRMNARKEAFEKANPDVVVEPDLWTFDIQTFYAKATGGKLPGIYNTAFTEIPEIINSGYSADISKVLKKRGYDGKFNKQILDLVSKDGGVYSFPYDAYVLGMAYNTELFAAAGLLEEDGTPKQPKDWYELADFAVKIKETTGKPGFLLPTMKNVGGWIFTPIAWSFGVDFMEQNEDGQWKATFDTPEAVEALQYVKDLKWKYDVLPANNLIDGNEMYKVFGVGDAGMMCAAGLIAEYVAQYGMEPKQFGIMAYPAGPKRHVTLLGGGLMSINNKYTEDQIDASVRWIETEYSFNLTDEYKTTLENSIKNSLEAGHLIGVKNMSVWSSDTETIKYRNELIDKYANINPNQVRLYNEFVEDCPADIQAEEAVCAQELYGILDGCIQEVLANKDADCAALIKNANHDLQVNYLDNLTY